MSIIIEEVCNKKGTLITCKDHVNWHDFNHVLTPHLSKDPEILRQYHFSIVDYSQVSSFSLAASDVFRIGKVCMKAAKNTRHTEIALVKQSIMPEKFLNLWLQITRNSGWNIELFNNYEEAALWVQKKMHSRNVSISENELFSYTLSKKMAIA